MMFGVKSVRGLLAGLFVAALVVPAVAQENQDGADTAEACANGILEAWKNGDVAGMKTFIPPDDREGFDRQGEAFVKALVVSSYEVHEVTVDEDAGSATATYTWECKLDAEKLVELMLGDIEESMRESGMSKEEIAEQLALMREGAMEELAGFAGHIEAADHTMTLTRIDGRWYCEQPMEDPDGSEPSHAYGADTAEEAAANFLAAFQAKDAGALEFIIHGSKFYTEWDSFDMLVMQATEIESIEIGEVTVNGNRALASFKMKASVDTEALAVAAMDARRQELTDMGWEGDDLEGMLKAYAEELAVILAAVKEEFAAESHTMSLRMDSDRWFVWEPSGASADELVRGAASAEAAAEAAFAALTSHNWDDANWIATEPLDDNDMQMLNCLWVHEFEIGEITETEDGATVTYTWTAELDMDSLVSYALVDYANELMNAGVEGEDYDKAMAEFEANFRKGMAGFKEFAERGNHTMRLVKGDDGRWYVAEIWVTE